MEHPAVQQVVTFAVADKMLGEEIGAAVVLADGGDLDAAGLLRLRRRTFAPSSRSPSIQSS